jgi:hypothetical protein
MLDRIRRATQTELIKLNPYAEAAKETANVLGMSGLTALSLATLNPLPLLVGAVAEAAYLLTVPDTDWYRNIVKGRERAMYKQAILDRREGIKQQVIPTLSPSVAQRFAKLEKLRTQIESEVGQGTTLYDDILVRLDELLERFLTMASTDQHFCAYLSGLESKIADELRTERSSRATGPKAEARPLSTSPGQAASQQSGSPAPGWVTQLETFICAHYDAERQRLEGEQTEQVDDDTRQVLEKRAQVLAQRSEYVHKIARILAKLQAQIDLLEDTFGLISDQIRARPPQEVLSEVEDVVMRTTLNSEVLNELAQTQRGAV